MNTLADALVEAVMFIAYRDYPENASVEDYEDDDVDALDNLKEVLQAATPDERELLRESVAQAIARLPEDSTMGPYYEVWMDNMFGAEGKE